MHQHNVVATTAQSAKIILMISMIMNFGCILNNDPNSQNWMAKDCTPSRK